MCIQLPPPKYLSTLQSLPLQSPTLPHFNLTLVITDSHTTRGLFLLMQGLLDPLPKKQIHPSKRIPARNQSSKREISPQKPVVLRGHRVVDC